MTLNKYSKVLTVILVILIILSIIGIGFLIYNTVIKPKKDEGRAIEAIEEFDRQVENNDEEDQEENIESNVDMNLIKHTDKPKHKRKKKVYYNNYVMIGYITIPKTNVKEPILDIVTPDSLNNAVAVIYPSVPKLNEPGNNVIIGHNYRNNKFFSNNDKLTVGDTLRIKDTTGRELTYTIYQKFETTPEDTSFYNRDTKGAVEVTLSTCTDDSKARIIILAKVE